MSIAEQQRVKELEAKVAALEARIAALEAKKTLTLPRKAQA